jgi:Membrane-associated phospholipid phosphatase|nr:MAG: phosphatidic acid phosphatase [Pseudomonadota bacterium]
MFRYRTSSSRHPGAGIHLALVAIPLIVAACAAAPASQSAGTAAQTADTAAPSTGAATQSTGMAGPSSSTGPQGYLKPDALDITAIIPRAPEKGDARDEADRRIFRETRVLEGTPRWAMAADDAKFSPADVLRHFSCSVDVELTPENAPRTVRVAQRALRDTGRAMSVAKAHFKRVRPYLVDEGPICVPGDELAKSYDYPSGHATAGWTWAMVLAQAVPERATQIFARGRAIGESRVVCGVHNASAVEAARVSTSAVMTVVMTTPEYQADLQAAREELEELRRTGPKPDPARCAEEAALIAETRY